MDKLLSSGGPPAVGCWSNGGPAIANVSGFKRIQGLPRCEDLKNLGQHLADWEETIGKYGQNLMRCQEELRELRTNEIGSHFNVV